MINEIGALGDNPFRLALDRRDHGFDRLFTEFLGAVVGALVEKLPGVRPVAAGIGAGGDRRGEIMDRKRFHVRTFLAFPPDGWERKVLRRLKFPGSSRIGSPARAMCS